MKSKTTLLQMAEATGYILRSDGSQIIAGLATPADLIYHMGIKHEEEVNMKQNNWFKGLNERLTCSFKTAQADNKATEIVNLYPIANGEFKKISFKTFKGLVSELDRANKNCKKYKIKTEIRIMLPIRGKLN